MSPAAMGPNEILVVEDDGDAALLLAMVLRREGYRVTVAPDLSSARGALAGGTVRALLSDLRLPDGCGLSLLDDGRPEGLAAAVALSGFDEPEDFERTRRAGFDVLLIKPVEPARLSALLTTLLSPPSLPPPP